MLGGSGTYNPPMRTLIVLGIPLILTAVMVFSIVDIVAVEPSRVKHLPKPAWVLIVIALTVLGSLLWFTLGRERVGYSPSGAPRGRGGPLAPDDDPEFLARLKRDRDQEERIRRLEQRLSDLDDDPKE